LHTSSSHSDLTHYMMSKVFGSRKKFYKIGMMTKFEFSSNSIKRKRGRGCHSFKGRSYYCPSNEGMNGDPFNVSIVVQVCLLFFVTCYHYVIS